MLLLPLVKALLLIARYFKRQALAQESLLDLYAQDCAGRGIYLRSEAQRRADADDKIEISYGSTHKSNLPPPDQDEDDSK